MKAQVNEGQKVVNVKEQKPGEAKLFTLTIKDPSGVTIESRPLLTEKEPEPPDEIPVATVEITINPEIIEVGKTATALATLKDAHGHPITDRQVAFTSAAPAIATVDAGGIVSGVAEGETEITASCEGKSDSAPVAVEGIEPEPEPEPPADSPAELPRALPTNITVPVGGNRLRVTSAADLQAALNNAKPGDTVLLAPGLVLPEEYVLPPAPEGNQNPPACELRTDIPKTPRSDTMRRMTPSKAAQLQLAKFIAPSSQPSLKTTQGANHTKNWILSDIEVTGRMPITSIQYGLLTLGDGGWTGGGEIQTKSEFMPTGFELDRVYVHGSDTLNCTRGIALNCGDASIRSSWIGEIHAQGFDSQAVCGWNGPGPYLLVDSTFEAGAENVMFGGADPGIDQLIPFDISIIGCHFPTPLEWKGIWAEKNPFELKSAGRVLIQGCVFDHSWIQGQLGMAIVIKSATGSYESGKTWQGTQDLTVRYCRFRQVHRGINLQARDGTTERPVKRVLFEHNLFEDVGNSNGIPASDGWLMLLTHDLENVTIRHNTLIGNADGKGLAIYMAYGSTNAPAKNLKINDNILAGRSYYAMGADGAPGCCKQAIDYYTGGSYEFNGNVVSQVSEEFQSKHPPGSKYVADYREIGLDASGRLKADSRFKNSATDGTDPGADVSEIERQTANAVVPR